MANYPNFYFPYQAQPTQYNAFPAQQNVSPTQAPQNNGIIWVQGEAGAKAYPVAAGNSVQLMDTEESVFYIKTVDQSGMPQPLRIFEYNEKTAQNRAVSQAAANTDVVTREEFEALREDVKRLSRGVRKPDVKEGDKDE